MQKPLLGAIHKVLHSPYSSFKGSYCTRFPIFCILTKAHFTNFLCFRTRPKILSARNWSFRTRTKAHSARKLWFRTPPKGLSARKLLFRTRPKCHPASSLWFCTRTKGLSASRLWFRMRAKRLFVNFFETQHA